MLSRANGLVLLNTIGLSLVKTGLSMTLALFLAWIVARTDTPHRDLLEVLITLPFYIPPILTAMAWGMLATPKGGLLNLAWTGLTGQREPLINIYSYGGVVWHMMQYSTPFLFLLMVGAFKSMDPALEESSRMSGASAWTTSGASRSGSCCRSPPAPSSCRSSAAWRASSRRSSSARRPASRSSPPRSIT